MPTTQVIIDRCPTEDYLEALGVLYRRMAPRWRPGVVADAYAEATAGEVDLSGLWIARKHGRIVGVFLTQCLAGHAAAIWPPEVEPGWNRSKTTDALIQAALTDLKGRGVKIAQALLDPEWVPPKAKTDLTRGGIPQVTILTYLERGTVDPVPVAPEVPTFDWRPYGPDTEDEFRQILEATYMGSLDMPELEGARSLDPIRETQEAMGRFDPGRWQIGRLAGEPEAAAILLLAETPDKSAWELSYLGLTPQARGRGLGRAALARARDLAFPCTRRLELAVDQRNIPADRLYASTGFVPFDRRIVHLAVLG